MMSKKCPELTKNVIVNCLIPTVLSVLEGTHIIISTSTQYKSQFFLRHTHTHKHTYDHTQFCATWLQVIFNEMVQTRFYIFLFKIHANRYVF